MPIFEAEIFAKKNRLTQTAMLYGCGNNIGNSAFANGYILKISDKKNVFEMNINNVDWLQQPETNYEVSDFIWNYAPGEPKWWIKSKLKTHTKKNAVI